ncbi:MAG: hypothetical protein QXN34_00595 [Archaeoglobaceae archaeon]
MKKLRDFSIGKVSININGDLSEKEIAEKGRIAEKSGLKVIWVGDFDFDPFLTAEILAKHTELLIGFGVLSVEKRECEKILSEIESLEERFGNRFLVGVGAGEFKDAKKAVEKVLRCIETLKPRKVFAGCSSPRIARLSSRIADGVLINYINPSLVKWLSSYIEMGLKIAYGPTLFFPSQFEEDLVLAAAIVLKGVEKRFGINLGLNLKELVSKRRRGESISDSGVFKHREFLLNNFALYGDLEEIKAKIKALLQICDHVVLSDPFFRDEQSLKNLELIVRACETF